MKKNFVKKLIALILALCMLLSLVPMSMISSSAKISLTSLDSWATNTLYTRGLSAAGSILETIGETSENENFAEFTSFINETFCGGSDTGEKIDQLQDTCNEILNTTKKVESVVTDINAKISESKITTSGTNCDNAWDSQVMDYITKNDESPYDFYNVYVAYRNYLKYAGNPSAIPKNKTLENYEDSFVSELGNYYKGKTNANFVGDKELYTTDTIDVCLTGMLKSILNTMDPKASSVGVGKRFIDLAAQYAFYAYPYSGEQAAFVDFATEYQVNTVTYLFMIYQDFLSRRADYFKNNKDEINAQKYQDIWDYCNKSYYDPLLDKYTEAIENFLTGDIYLKEVDAHTTLDKYVRKDSITVYDNDKKTGYTLTNNNYKTKHNDRYVHCTTEYYYKSDITSYPVFTSKNMSFYKNVSITINKNRQLEFKPFYVLNSNSIENCYRFLKTFDLNDEDVHGEIQLFAYYDTHYMNVDYYNLKDGKFSDGVNNFVPISSTDQLKSLINETYYTANKCSPYTYFSSLIGSNSNNPMYLLLKGKTAIPRPENTTHYMRFPVFNMSNTKSYSDKWDSELMNLYNLQSDRKAKDNKTNSMYTVILVPEKNTLKSKVDTKITGEGKVTVSNVSNGTAVSGGKVKINITLPEERGVSRVIAQYHDDLTNPTKVTDEKVLSGGVDLNELSIDYTIPYSNVTIVVETKDVPTTLNVDSNGNYIVSSYDDLVRMSRMVNSGKKQYVSGNYVLTSDIVCSENDKWFECIGTDEIPFSGTFDGQGHTLGNLVLDGHAVGDSFGLFGVVKSGTIKNLNLTIRTFSSYNKHTNVGGLCGKITDGTISNCTAKGNLIGFCEYLAAITATAIDSTITGCSTNVTLIKDVEHKAVDEICSNAINSQIVDCEATGQVLDYTV